MTIKGFESMSLLFIMSKNHVECNMQIFKIRIFTLVIQAGNRLADAQREGLTGKHTQGTVNNVVIYSPSPATKNVSESQLGQWM